MIESTKNPKHAAEFPEGTAQASTDDGQEKSKNT